MDDVTNDDKARWSRLQIEIAEIEGRLARLVRERDDLVLSKHGIRAGIVVQTPRGSGTIETIHIPAYQTLASKPEITARLFLKSGKPGLKTITTALWEIGQ